MSSWWYIFIAEIVVEGELKDERLAFKIEDHVLMVDSIYMVYLFIIYAYLYYI